MGKALLEKADPPMSFPFIDEHYNIWQGFFAETMTSFILMYTVYGIATSVRTADNQYVGMIGLCILWKIVAVSRISGAVFNPSIGIVIPLVVGVYKDIWLYIVTACLGMLMAWCLFRLTHAFEFRQEKRNVDRTSKEIELIQKGVFSWRSKHEGKKGEDGEDGNMFSML